MIKKKASKCSTKNGKNKKWKKRNVLRSMTDMYSQESRAEMADSGNFSFFHFTFVFFFTMAMPVVFIADYKCMETI